MRLFCTFACSWNWFIYAHTSSYIKRVSLPRRWTIAWDLGLVFSFFSHRCASAQYPDLSQESLILIPVHIVLCETQNNCFLRHNFCKFVLTLSDFKEFIKMKVTFVWSFPWSFLGMSILLWISWLLIFTGSTGPGT